MEKNIDTGCDLRADHCMKVLLADVIGGGRSPKMSECRVNLASRPEGQSPER